MLFVSQDKSNLVEDGLLRFGHAHVLTVHRTVIHSARAASLRPLQKLFYIAGAIHELPEINVPHKTNHQEGETEHGCAFVFKYSGS